MLCAKANIVSSATADFRSGICANYKAERGDAGHENEDSAMHRSALHKGMPRCLDKSGQRLSDASAASSDACFIEAEATPETPPPAFPEEG